MSEILIKGMELPKKGEKVTIELFSDGLWCDYNNNNYHGKAIEVPPHGDLIERSEVVSCLDRYIKFNLEQDNDISAVRALSFAEADVLRDGKGIYKKYPICIPTVIEASTK